MVKGLDFTASDTSKMVLDYLFRFFSTPSPLSIDQAQKHVFFWLQNESSISKVYKKFQNLKIKPKITLIHKCKSPLVDFIPSENDSYFPASQNDDQIQICLNHIKNKIQLKENLDRELYAMYQTEILKEKMDQTESQKILMRSLYTGCLEGYRNYGFDEKNREKLSKKCASYLFRRRSSSKLPYDSLFRYSSKMADDICV